ncbi:MAG: TlpA disulfide reductase family protein [Thioalkalispiraceae bacterium]|jgi:peroxiredoxin
MTKNIRLLPLLAAIIFSLTSLTAHGSGLKTGDKAPEFQLHNLKGQMITLSGLLKKGHVMLVFWEPNCVYCFAHIEDFNALQEQYKKDLTITGVNFLGEYREDVQAYANDNNVKYMLLADRLNNIDVAEAYKVIGSPTIVVISPEGKILSYGYKLPKLSQWLN